MISPPVGSGGRTTVEIWGSFSYQLFCIQQPAHTILDFHLMLTHCLSCSQPHRLNTKPSFLPSTSTGQKPAPPAPMADKGDTQRDPTPTWQLHPGCQSLPAGRLYVPLQILPLSHPWALHTTYRLMQTYVTAHPSGLVTLSSQHTHTHNTNPSLCSRESMRFGKPGLGSS